MDDSCGGQENFHLPELSSTVTVFVPTKGTGEHVTPFTFSSVNPHAEAPRGGCRLGRD